MIHQKWCPMKMVIACCQNLRMFCYPRFKRYLNGKQYYPKLESQTKMQLQPWYERWTRPHAHFLLSHSHNDRNHKTYFCIVKIYDFSVFCLVSRHLHKAKQTAFNVLHIKWSWSLTKCAFFCMMMMMMMLIVEERQHQLNKQLIIENKTANFVLLKLWRTKAHP